MANIKKMALTDLGRADLTRAKAEETSVKWKTVCIGDGNGTVPPVNPKATRLVNEKWSGELTSKLVDAEDPTLLTIHAVIPGEVGDFWVREAGIKNDKGELVLVAETIVTEKLSFETSGVLSELDLYFDLKIENSDLIEVAIDPSNVYATMNEMENLREHVAQKSIEIDEKFKEKSQELESNVNSTIVNFEQTLNEFKTETKTEITEDITELTENITEINGDLTGLESRVDALEKNIQSLAGNQEPEEPVENMVWFDLENRIIKVYNGEAWIPFGAVYL